MVSSWNFTGPTRPSPHRARERARVCLLPRRVEPQRPFSGLEPACVWWCLSYSENSNCEYHGSSQSLKSCWNLNQPKTGCFPSPTTCKKDLKETIVKQPIVSAFRPKEPQMDSPKTETQLSDVCSINTLVNVSFFSVCFMCFRLETKPSCFIFSKGALLNKGILEILLDAQRWPLNGRAAQWETRRFGSAWPFLA